MTSTLRDVIRRTLYAVLACFLMTSCANTPKEVVELSYTIGRDIDALRSSYKILIHEHYESLRDQRQRYLDQQWKPAFIKAWIADGYLIQMASGKEVYSSEKDDFVAPTPGKAEAQLLEGVSGWAEDAVDKIAQKRRELMAPLDKEEQELNSTVDEAFQRIMRGNATVTAHLNSLRKVQQVQDDFLAALDLKDLRTTINDKLASASERAESALSAVREADQKLISGGKKLKKLSSRKSKN